MTPGMVFVPFHWGDLFGEGNAANYLTISAIGRVAKQPELKFCAVSVERVEARKSSRAPAASGSERAAEPRAGRTPLTVAT
jgi:sulfite reductase (NADPH) flavoprotein alpha-component